MLHTQMLNATRICVAGTFSILKNFIKGSLSIMALLLLLLQRMLLFSLINIYGAVHCTQSHNSVPIVDVVITLKTGVDIVRGCIESLIRHEPSRDVLKQRIILVNDGSPAETIVFKKSLCAKDPERFLCSATSKKDPAGTGYTVAINIGISLAQKMGLPLADSVVLLNSDTVVSDNWLNHLHDALFSEKNPSLGIVGPISNAATVQSAPRMYDTDEYKTNSWTTNLPLPAGTNFDSFAREVERFVTHHRLSVIPVEVLNGFCYMIKRTVFDKVGLFDQEHLPKGYGEEEDFSYRATKAGFTSAVVPSVYIFHHKTKSFTAAEKDTLKAAATKYIFSTYGPRKPDMGKEIREGEIMGKIRQFSGNLLQEQADKYSYLNRRWINGDFIHPANSGAKIVEREKSPSILFVTHSVALGGGVVSILQEALQMFEYGINVAISMPENCAGGKSMDFVRALLPHASQNTIDQLIRYHSGLMHYPNPVPEDWFKMASTYDILIATFCLTMPAVESVVAAHPHIMPAYYVQDYEPWFWSGPFGENPGIGDHVEKVRSTYTANNGKTLIMSKTRWTAEMVASNHNVTVHKVIPSLDHTMYFPNKTEITRRLQKTSSNGQFKVLAMVRPRTPRRNPEMTVEVVTRLAKEHPDRVQISLIGCPEDHLMMSLESLIRMKGQAAHRTRSYLLDAPNVRSLGLVYERSEMAQIMRGMDIFIDLSWWQAFGRAGIEAMACGVISIMPLTGAAPEICREDLEFCQYHDGMDPDGVVDKVVALIGNDSMRHDLIRKGMQRSRHFSIEAAAASMANQLYKGLIGHRAL